MTSPVPPFPHTTGSTSASTSPHRGLLACSLACGLLVAGQRVGAQVTPANLHLFSHEGTATDSHYGFRISKAGDVDMDGHPDILVGSPLSSVGSVPQAGRVYVYSGADGRLLHAFDGDPTPGFWLGWPVSDAGDVDGDGAPDVMAAFRAGVVVHSGRTGSELLRLASGMSTDATLAALGDTDGDGRGDLLVATVTEARVFSGRDGSVLRSLGTQVAADAAGDVDGDGVVDIVVGESRFGSTGRALLRSGRDGAVLHTIAAPAGITNFGAYVAPAGDIDADGHADVVAGDRNGTGNAFVFSGRDGTLLRQVAGGSAPLAHHPRPAGDVDGDGAGDVLMTRQWGQVVVVSGRTGGTLADYRKNPAGIFGLSTDGLGDVDGDGFDDVLVGDYTGGPSFTGSAHVLSGRALALTTDTHAIAVAGGGAQSMRLDFGAAHAGDRFVFVGSASGTAPGLLLGGGRHLPLNLDAYLLFSAANPGLLLQPALGTLDGTGAGTATLNWPGGLGVSPGTRLHHAAILLSADLLRITETSNAAPLLLR